MDAVPTVTVYAFSVVDIDVEADHFASFKAPRHVIGERFGGTVLEGTGEEVSIEDLDEQGRYRRIATGWGVLD